MERTHQKKHHISLRIIFLILAISAITIPCLAKASSNESSYNSTGIKKRTLGWWSEFKDDVIGIDPPKPPPPPPASPAIQY